MSRNIVILLAIVAVLSGCFNKSVTNDDGPLVFENINTECLYQLYINPYIEAIVVDIDYAEGNKPSFISVSAIRENIATVAPHRRVDIPEPTLIHVGDNSEKRVWTLEEFSEIATKNKNFYGNHTVTIHILILNGMNDQGNGVVGYFQPTVNAIAFFPDVTFMASAGEYRANYPVFYEYIERGVLIHELGHALGLVNFGAPMQIKRLPPEADDPCQCHSTESDSPMYYRGHGGIWFLELVQENEYVPYKFTAIDLKDIQAFRDSFS